MCQEKNEKDSIDASVRRLEDNKKQQRNTNCYDQKQQRQYKEQQQQKQ